MQTAQITNLDENRSALICLYQNLSMGATFLDSHMIILSANEKMKTYFHSQSNSSIGLSFGDAVCCQHVKNGQCGQFPYCDRYCLLFKAVNKIVQNRESVNTMRLRYTCSYESHQDAKWLCMNGIPYKDRSETYAILFFDDITNYIQREKRLQDKLKWDLPTKVLNKYGLIKYLKSFLMTNKKVPVSVCMIDFDNFKTINDRYGHIMGDRVLNTFSKIARKNIRAVDIIGRYGGEEFLFIFHRTQLEQATRIISRIQNELRIAFVGILPVQITFSAGIVYFSGEGNLTDGWKSMVQEVDRLLYQAKENGKDQIVTKIFFTTG